MNTLQELPNKQEPAIKLRIVRRSTSARLEQLSNALIQMVSRLKFIKMDQWKPDSTCMKISCITLVEFTITFMDKEKEDTLLRSLDGEKKETFITGSVLTHGVPSGELTDSSKLNKESVESMPQS